MSIFERARDLVRPRPTHTTKDTFAIPFGLNAEEWAALKTLPSHPGWSIFIRTLDATSKLLGETMLQSSKAESLHFLRGSVSGLRKAATLIDVESQKEMRFARDKQRVADGSRRRERDTAALFGTPGWRSKSNSDA